MSDDYRLKRWANYQDWFNKKAAKGINMSEQSRRCANSYEVFEKRYDNLLQEIRRTGKKDSVMDLMKERSYAGGTRGQIKMYYDSVVKGMEQLKEEDEDLYHQLNEEWGFKLKDKTVEQIIQQQHGRNGGGWLNPDYDETGQNGPMGMLQIMYYTLKNNDIVVNFSSPD